MTFMCNSCFVLMENGQMPGGPCVITSCFHIFCYACSLRIRNKQCLHCAKPCGIQRIGKNMQPALQMYFEPPLSKVDKLQKQFAFLQQQQQITLKLKKAADDNKKKFEKIQKTEERVKTEAHRIQKISKEKMEMYRNIKEKYQKINAEDQRLRKYLEDNGCAFDKDLKLKRKMKFEKEEDSGYEEMLRRYEFNFLSPEMKTYCKKIKGCRDKKK